MITANKIAITISEIVLVNNKKEVDGDLPTEVAVGEGDTELARS